MMSLNDFLNLKTCISNWNQKSKFSWNEYQENKCDIRYLELGESMCLLLCKLRARTLETSDCRTGLKKPRFLEKVFRS